MVCPTVQRIEANPPQAGLLEYNTQCMCNHKSIHLRFNCNLKKSCVTVHTCSACDDPVPEILRLCKIRFQIEGEGELYEDNYTS